MENSAIKIIRSIFSKRNVDKFKRHLNKKTILIANLTLFFLIFTFYLIKPAFFNYNAELKNIEKKINTHFNLDVKINGNINYKFFPSPRIEINKLNLNFGNLKKEILIEQAYILIPFFKGDNLNKFELKKFFVLKQNIKIYPKDFNNYLKYFTVLKDKDIIFKKCSLFFLDNQNNKVLFNDFTLSEKFNKNLHSINLKLIFSNKKVIVKFKDNLQNTKKLDIELPQLDASANVIFDPSSSLDGVKAKSKINIFDNIFVLNFEGKNKFKIYDSFFRNKFFNSKINGDISFINNFLFNIKLDINQINLRKFLLYYFPENKNFNFLNSNISKKINGKLNISMKNTNSFIGRIKDLKMLLTFENGDLRIQDGYANLPYDSKINFNILYSDNSNDPFLDFSLNFETKNKKDFLRKFNIYDAVNEESIVALGGKIFLKKNEIKFRNILANNKEKFSRQDLSNLEKNFNQFILEEGIIGITDFFKLKKFAKETLN